MKRDPYVKAEPAISDYACPAADSRDHHIELWTDPGPCPGCGTVMTRDDATLILWD